MLSQGFGDAGNVLVERRLFSGGQNKRQVRRAALDGVELCVFRKSAVELEDGAQLFRGRVGFRVVSHVSIAEVRAPEKVAEVNCLPPGDQLFRQAETTRGVMILD